MKTIAVIVWIACTGCGSIPEGRFRCASASDCPAGWYCRDDRCHSTPGGATDAGIDARIEDAGTDAGAIDAGCRFSSECDDDNDCTEDRCESGVCVWIPENAPGVACDDGNACTTSDTCVPSEGRCEAISACDDGNACTFGDTCASDGSCRGTAYSCPVGINGGLDALCDGAGGCACPAGLGRLCNPAADPASGCFPQCCPGEPDRPNTCSCGNCGTSVCGSDGVLSCASGCC